MEYSIDIRKSRMSIGEERILMITLLCMLFAMVCKFLLLVPILVIKIAFAPLKMLLLPFFK